MIDDNLKNEIEQLVALGAEGDYWDFKEKWHANNADLLHDIICMANNLANRDAYIIIGVEDKTFKVKGVPDDYRKSQQNLIDFLKGMNFAGGVRPTVYVKTVSICGMDIDVVIIKNTTTTPYYLMENYSRPKKEKDGKPKKDKDGKVINSIVYAAHIYTRIGDVNIGKKDTADEDKRLYLWKKRFGIDLTPFEKIKFLLKEPKDWLPMGTDGKHSTNIHNCKGIWYNKNNPEFTISYEDDVGRFDKGRIDVVEHDIFWMKKLPRPLHNTYIYNLKVNYHSTVWFSTLAIFADGFRFQRVLWKRETLFENVSKQGIQYIYIEKDSLDFLIDDWLNNHHETVSQTEDADFYPSLEPWIKQPEYTGCFNPYSVVPVFESAEEHKMFIDFVKSHRDKFLDLVGDYSFSNSEYKKSEYIRAAYPDYIDYLCKVGETLVSWLECWRFEKANFH